jgi:hypothetical protein
MGYKFIHSFIHDSLKQHSTCECLMRESLYTQQQMWPKSAQELPHMVHRPLLLPSLLDPIRVQAKGGNLREREREMA